MTDSIKKNGAFYQQEIIIDDVTKTYIPVVSSAIHDSTGGYTLNTDSLPQTMTYGGPGGSVDTITAGPDAQGFRYKQTLTYTGNNVTSISAWVKQ
jgi:hypothetical protein